MREQGNEGTRDGTTGTKGERYKGTKETGNEGARERKGSIDKRRKL
jgi:hypothetical protein